MTLFEKICRMVGDRRIPSPKMPAFRWFTVGFANKHVTTIVVMAIIVSAAAVSVGMYFAIRDVVGSTYNWPEPAEYDVTHAGLNTMGQKNPNYADGSESQTLSVRLADGARISTLRIKDTDLGRSGISRALDISPLTNAVTGATAYLWVGNLTVTNSSFPTLNMETSDVATLTLGTLCDGHTLAATVSNTVSDMVLESERLSSTYEVSDSIVDRIQIHITGNSGAFVENLILDNVDAWAGAAHLARMKIGTMTMNNSNKVGDGSGVDSASCVINSSVNSKNITNTIQDQPITVK
jgi:hypothetical protein